MTEAQLWDRIGHEFELQAVGEETPSWATGLCGARTNLAFDFDLWSDKSWDSHWDDTVNGLLKLVAPLEDWRGGGWWWPRRSREHAYDRAMCAYLLREIAKHE